MEKILGNHTIVEFYGCLPSIISDSKEVEEALLEAAHLSHAKIIDSNFHYFKPYGVSGVVIIAESHFSVPTWPEYNYAALDFFSCSDVIDVDFALNYLKGVFLPQDVKITHLVRGIVKT